MKDAVSINIEYDADWENNLKLLDGFYTNHYLPKLICQEAETAVDD